MAKRRRNPSGGVVEYAGPGSILPYERNFKPHKARGGEMAILREPRAAIRENPFAFLIGAFAAGVIGTLVYKGATSTA